MPIMIHMDEPTNNQRVLISAKVPVEVKSAVERLAERDRRTVSNYLESLLADHPIIRTEIEFPAAPTT